jgi:hypothetical protein
VGGRPDAHYMKYVCEMKKVRAEGATHCICERHIAIVPHSICLAVKGFPKNKDNEC